MIRPKATCTTFTKGQRKGEEVTKVVNVISESGWEFYEGTDGVPLRNQPTVRNTRSIHSWLGELLRPYMYRLNKKSES